MLPALEKHFLQLGGVISSMEQLPSDFSERRGLWGGAVMVNLMGHMRFEPSLEELGQYYKQGHCEQMLSGGAVGENEN